VAAIVKLPPARTEDELAVVLLMNALVPTLTTATAIEAEMPADVEAPIEAAMMRRVSELVAVIDTLPPATASAPAPMEAFVSLLMTSTTTPAPMPTDPVLPPRPPAPLTRLVLSVAESVMC
jgi:hypothetical protein